MLSLSSLELRVLVIQVDPLFQMFLLGLFNRGGADGQWWEHACHTSDQLFCFRIYFISFTGSHYHPEGFQFDHFFMKFNL
jgi:hypothetical protein